MAMKETARSLTMYFVFAGAIAVGLAIRDISSFGKLDGLSGGQKFAVYFSVAVGLGLGAAFLVAAATLKQALRVGGGWIKTMVLVAGAFVVIDTAIVIGLIGDLPGVRTGAITRAIVGILIALYLRHNITRLATESSATAQARVA